MTPTKTLASVLTTLAVALAVPAAQAAERHAGPAGSGSVCSVAAPCSIQTAFSGAASGDQITLAPGDYGSPSARLTDQLADNWKSLAVRGEPGAARPRIWSAASGGGLVLQSPDSSLSNVDIDYSRADGPALWGNLGSIDHVRIESKGLGISLSNGTNATVTIANTSVHASAEGGYGLSLGSVRSGPDFAVELVLRNVTIVDNGLGSPALWAYSLGLGGAKMTVTVSAFNSIMRGSAYDISAGAESPGDKVAVALDHSSFATVQTYGAGTTSVSAATENGNQSAAPVFLDLAGGDLRQAVDSPTIDAGAANPLAGATDSEGDPRVAGAAIDIGADEYIAPPPVPSGGEPGLPPGDVTGAGQPGPAAETTPGGTPTPPASGAGGPHTPLAACVVPRVTGKTLKAARAALAKAGCATGTVTRKRAARKIGKVVAQKARPGARLAAGAKVALVIGKRA
jgi:hypothetical protein